jgi:hypothetical protein
MLFEPYFQIYLCFEIVDGDCTNCRKIGRQK